MRVLRVLVVTNMYPSPGRPALGRFVRDQVEALRAAGVAVEVFSFTPGGTAYARAARALRRRYGATRFDVVHAHYGLSGWPALAVRARRRVVTYHGTDLEHPVVGPLSRALARIVDLPAPVSAELARRGLPDPDAAAVLPCGPDLSRFERVERAAARRALGLDPEGHYLLFPADPARREKRYDRARAVVDGLPGSHLLTYAGTAPDQVPLVIQAADAVLAPSEREGFGLAPLEALACDVPVAATPVGIAPVALAGVEGCLCVPFDAERWRAWARARRGERVAGRARAALFAHDRMAARVLAAYRELLDQQLCLAAR